MTDLFFYSFCFRSCRNIFFFSPYVFFLIYRKVSFEEMFFSSDPWLQLSLFPQISRYSHPVLSKHLFAGWCYRTHNWHFEPDIFLKIIMKITVKKIISVDWFWSLTTDGNMARIMLDLFIFTGLISVPSVAKVCWPWCMNVQTSWQELSTFVRRLFFLHFSS